MLIKIVYYIFLLFETFFRFFATYIMDGIVRLLSSHQLDVSPLSSIIQVKEEIIMKRAVKTFFIALFGAFLGWLLGSMFEPESIYGYVIFFMGFPFGWSFLGKYVGHLVSTNFALMATIFIFRVIVAGIIGFVILPIELILSLIEVFTGGGE